MPETPIPLKLSVRDVAAEYSPSASNAKIITINSNITATAIFALLRLFGLATGDAVETRELTGEA